MVIGHIAFLAVDQETTRQKDAHVSPIEHEDQTDREESVKEHDSLKCFVEEQTMFVALEKAE